MKERDHIITFIKCAHHHLLKDLFLGASDISKSKSNLNADRCVWSGMMEKFCFGWTPNRSLPRYCYCLSFSAYFFTRMY
jgi:hypothetical protein